ncbi:Uncharacterised protein [Mycobacteroides abscessus subsp. abscessus]|nr:Uncharacterised protein [Mycobacteroides abscessus subsp. abscessus]
MLEPGPDRVLISRVVLPQVIEGFHQLTDVDF